MRQVAGGEEVVVTATGVDALPQGRIVILEGHSPLSARLGVEMFEGITKVRQIRDVTAPELPIIWEREQAVPNARLSPEWSVRGHERWTRQPVLAVRRVGDQAVIWTATEIGESGYERYPFLPQALQDAGWKPQARARNLWAFFDAGYRLRMDQRYLVERWREAGISAIHVTSWQFDGADEERATWLARLIALCHERLIQVYAWVELPHVSERFWNTHPECRERTATGAEARLDWRSLINLVNSACAERAEADVLSLLRSYDWDGVNLGELYFESLEGHENLARFTPFNDDVREEYRRLHGADMMEDLQGGSVPRVLEYRVHLAARLQQRWLARLRTIREQKPNFDIVLTHIDDRFDTRMRAALGADAARLLQATEPEGARFLIEDPATVWHLGPQRYPEIRKRYEGLTAKPGRLAIDINIVDRYQDVFPTKQQTGVELAQLVHAAAQAFPQVALYFEYSLRPYDLPFLSVAAVSPLRAREVRVEGPVNVDGVDWPFASDGWATIPAGEHTIRAGGVAPFRVLDHNFELLAVRRTEEGYTIAGQSEAGASVVFDRRVAARLEGGGELGLSVMKSGNWKGQLPRGEFTLVVDLPGVSETRSSAASAGYSSRQLPRQR
jgi:hypothetical protein